MDKIRTYYGAQLLIYGGHKAYNMNIVAL